jgi:hypothetical protein
MGNHGTQFDVLDVDFAFALDDHVEADEIGLAAAAGCHQP